MFIFNFLYLYASAGLILCGIITLQESQLSLSILRYMNIWRGISNNICKKSISKKSMSQLLHFKSNITFSWYLSNFEFSIIERVCSSYTHGEINF